MDHERRCKRCLVVIAADAGVLIPLVDLCTKMGCALETLTLTLTETALGIAGSTLMIFVFSRSLASTDLGGTDLILTEMTSDEGEISTLTGTAVTRSGYRYT